MKILLQNSKIFPLILVLINSTFTKDLFPEDNLGPDFPELQQQTSFSSKKFEEQISCPKEICIELRFGDYEDSELWKLFGKKAGKIAVHIPDNGLKLNDPNLYDHLEYIREISKREGFVSFEPFYIRTKGASEWNFGLASDIWSLGNRLYTRIRSWFFGRMGTYNAKVLYHPNTKNIMMIFYYHKNFGSLCDTIYSRCEEVQYLDDASFDSIVSQKMYQKKENINIRFDQVKAFVPNSQISFESLSQNNTSIRIYKWMIASNKTEFRTIAKERFLDIELAVTILDYTLTAFEWIEQIYLYKPARNYDSIIYYKNDGEGKPIIEMTLLPKSARQ